MTNENKKLRRITLGLIAKHAIVNVTLNDVCVAARIPPGSFQHHTGFSFGEYLRRLKNEGHIGPPVPVKKNRVDPELMEAHLMNMAVSMSIAYGYLTVNLTTLAMRADISYFTTHKMFGCNDVLHDHIMHAAVRDKIKPIIAQGLTAKHRIARKAPTSLKNAALNSVKTG